MANYENQSLQLLNPLAYISISKGKFDILAKDFSNINVDLPTPALYPLHEGAVIPDAFINIFFFITIYNSSFITQYYFFRISFTKALFVRIKKSKLDDFSMPSSIYICLFSL